MTSTADRILAQVEGIREAIAEVRRMLEARRRDRQEASGDGTAVRTLPARCDGCQAGFCALAGQEEGREHPRQRKLFPLMRTQGPQRRLLFV